MTEIRCKIKQEVHTHTHTHTSIKCYKKKKYIEKRFIENACFPYRQLPSVDVDKHHDGSPSKLDHLT